MPKRLRRPEDDALIYAVRSLDPKGARSALRAGANSNVTAADGNPLVVIAATTEAPRQIPKQKLRAKRSELLALLHEAGASYEPLGLLLSTALDFAPVAMFREMIAADAELDEARGPNPLATAVRKGLREHVAALLDAGASVAVAESRTPLILVAALHGDASMIHTLAAAGAPIGDHRHIEIPLVDADVTPNPFIPTRKARKRPGPPNPTPLVQAAFLGHDEAVEALIALGAPVDDCDDAGQSALGYAIARGHDAVVRRLRRAGASERPVPPPNQALLIALDSNDVGAARAALARGADPNLRDTRPESRDHRLLCRYAGGPPVLFVAVVRGALEIAAALVSGGLQVNSAIEVKGVFWGDAGRPERVTPLRFCVWHNAVDIVRALMEAGASVSEAGTALVDACLDGHQEVAQVLLDAGVPITSRSDEYTALQAAASDRRKEMVRFLLDRGAPINEGAGEDRTALDTAVSDISHYNHRRYPPSSYDDGVEVVRMLIEAGGQLTRGRRMVEFQIQRGEPKLALVLQPFLAKSKPPANETAKTPREPASPKRRTGPSTSRDPRPRARLIRRRSRLEAARIDLEALVSSGVRDESATEGAYLLTVRRGRKLDLVEARRTFAERGVLIFASKVTLPGKRITEIVALPSDDPLDAVRWAQTAGPNYDVGNRAIVAALKTLGPVEIHRAGHDTVEGRALRRLRSPKSVAAELVELCPDLEDVDAVARRLADDGSFALWWD